ADVVHAAAAAEEHQGAGRHVRTLDDLAGLGHVARDARQLDAEGGAEHVADQPAAVEAGGGGAAPAVRGAEQGQCPLEHALDARRLGRVLVLGLRRDGSGRCGGGGGRRRRAGGRRVRGGPRRDGGGGRGRGGQRRKGGGGGDRGRRHRRGHHGGNGIGLQGGRRASGGGGVLGQRRRSGEGEQAEQEAGTWAGGAAAGALVGFRHALSTLVSRA